MMEAVRHILDIMLATPRQLMIINQEIVNLIQEYLASHSYSMKNIYG